MLFPSAPLTKASIVFALSFFLTQCSWFSKRSSQPIENSMSYNSQGPIVVFGDSLAYGHGAISEHNTLTGCFKSAYTSKEVHNMGRNGATSSDMMGQLERVQNLQPSLVLVSLGGNDVLRQVSSETTMNNLEQIFTRLISSGSIVMYLGLKPPQSFFMGRILDVKRFQKIQELAKEKGVLVIEDAFAGLWKKPQYMFDDIHPNDSGYNVICTRLLELLKPHYE